MDGRACLSEFRQEGQRSGAVAGKGRGPSGRQRLTRRAVVRRNRARGRRRRPPTPCPRVHGSGANAAGHGLRMSLQGEARRTGHGASQWRPVQAGSRRQGPRPRWIGPQVRVRGLRTGGRRAAAAARPLDQRRQSSKTTTPLKNRTPAPVRAAGVVACCYFFPALLGRGRFLASNASGFRAKPPPRPCRRFQSSFSAFAASCSTAARATSALGCSCVAPREARLPAR